MELRLFILLLNHRIHSYTSQHGTDVKFRKWKDGGFSMPFFG